MSSEIEYNSLAVIEGEEEMQQQQPRASFCSRTRILVLIGALSLIVGTALYMIQEQQHSNAQQRPSLSSSSNNSNLRPYAEGPEPDEYFHQFNPSSAVDQYQEMHDSEGRPLDDMYD